MKIRGHILFSFKQSGWLAGPKASLNGLFICTHFPKSYLTASLYHSWVKVDALFQPGPSPVHRNVGFSRGEGRIERKLEDGAQKVQWFFVIILVSNHLSSP